jgi:hypothetical protein
MKSTMSLASLGTEIDSSLDVTAVTTNLFCVGMSGSVLKNKQCDCSTEQVRPWPA